MGHEFEIRKEITLEATPEQVWEAIATGPGIDSWFMGRNEVEGRQGGKATMDMGGFTSESTITAWEPGRRYAITSEAAPDGTFMAFEYLLEGREGGSTVLRFVHSGILGDDWEAEYNALQTGDWMYLLKLATYVKNFSGRTSTSNVFALGPQLSDKDKAWAAIRSAFALGGDVAVGDKAQISIDGLTPEDGVVDFVKAGEYIGVRTDDGILMIVHGYQDTVVAEHHIFASKPSHEDAEQAWQAWLAGAFA